MTFLEIVKKIQKNTDRNFHTENMTLIWELWGNEDKEEYELINFIYCHLLSGKPVTLEIQAKRTEAINIMISRLSEKRRILIENAI